MLLVPTYLLNTMHSDRVNVTLQVTLRIKRRP